MTSTGHVRRQAQVLLARAGRRAPARARRWTAAATSTPSASCSTRCSRAAAVRVGDAGGLPRQAPPHGGPAARHVAAARDVGRASGRDRQAGAGEEPRPPVSRRATSSPQALDAARAGRRRAPARPIAAGPAAAGAPAVSGRRCRSRRSWWSPPASRLPARPPRPADAPGEPLPRRPRSARGVAHARAAAREATPRRDPAAPATDEPGPRAAPPAAAWTMPRRPAPRTADADPRRDSLASRKPPAKRSEEAPPEVPAQMDGDGDAAVSQVLPPLVDDSCRSARQHRGDGPGAALRTCSSPPIPTIRSRPELRQRLPETFRRLALGARAAGAADRAVRFYEAYRALDFAPSNVGLDARFGGAPAGHERSLAGQVPGSGVRSTRVLRGRRGARPIVSSGERSPMTLYIGTWAREALQASSGRAARTGTGPARPRTSPGPITMSPGVATNSSMRAATLTALPSTV